VLKMYVPVQVPTSAYRRTLYQSIKEEPAETQNSNRLDSSLVRAFRVLNPPCGPTRRTN
jgi:hypothetical protein